MQDCSLDPPIPVPFTPSLDPGIGQELIFRRIISPPYTVTSEDIEFIVLGVSRLVEDYFARRGVTGVPQI